MNQNKQIFINVVNKFSYKKKHLFIFNHQLTDKSIKIELSCVNFHPFCFQVSVHFEGTIVVVS